MEGTTKKIRKKISLTVPKKGGKSQSGNKVKENERKVKGNKVKEWTLLLWNGFYLILEALDALKMKY